MGTTAKWTLALGTVGWYFTPSVAEVPFGGPPLTRMSLLAFTAAWLLLFVVWPWRTQLARGWVWTLTVLLVLAVALKVTAQQMSSPQGLIGTYRHLIGSPDLTTTVRSLSLPDLSDRPSDSMVSLDDSSPPAWRRLDRALQFSNNGFSPTGDSFHLLHTNRPPWSHYPKKTGPDGKPPSSDTRDGCGMLVTWRGCLDFPRQASTCFRPALTAGGRWKSRVSGSPTTVGRVRCCPVGRPSSTPGDPSILGRSRW